MATNRDTVRLLCKSIMNRLENNKVISFPPRLRQIIQDEIFGLIGPAILTEQDLRDRALTKVGVRAEMLADTNFTEGDQYKAAKAVVRATFGDDELHGFYFQKTVKAIAKTIAEYLMRSSHIDDVYETDEDIEKAIVEVIQKFDASQAH